MLVRIKLQDTTTAADLVANIKTIVQGSMTVTGNVPNNLTGVDNDSSRMVGTLFTNANSKYSVAGDVVTKEHYNNSSYSSGFELEAGSNNLNIIGYGDPTALTTPTDTAQFDADLSSNYLDVIVNDKIFAINQVVGSKLVIIADLAVTSFITSAFPDTIAQFYEFTTAADINHQRVEFAKIYSDADDAYVTKAINANINFTPKIHSIAADHIQTVDNTVVPLSSVMVGLQTEGLYPVHGLKGIANTPLFSGGGTLDDGNNNYYYTTGKKGFYGTTSTSSNEAEHQLGSQIVLEIQ